MFSLEEFFKKPLSQEEVDAELLRRRRVAQDEAAAQPVSGWKPKHDASFYDAKIRPEEVEEPQEMLPEGPLVIRDDDVFSLPGVPPVKGKRTLAREGRARKEERKATRATREAKKQRKAELRALREALPPVDETLTGTEAKLDAFLRTAKRTTAYLGSKLQIIKVLEEIHERIEVNWTGCEVYVKRLHDLSMAKDFNRVIVPGIGQRLVANILGYHSWTDMKAASLVNRTNVKNLRLGMEFDIPSEALLAVHKADVLLQKKNAGVKTMRKLRNDEAEVFRGEMVVGKFAASEMGDIVDEYAAMFRTPWLVGDRDALKAIAVKRFFMLDSVAALAPYIVAKTFPPGFRPGMIEKRECQLFFHIRRAMMEDRKFTARTAFEELEPWCATPEIAQELLRTIGELSGGKASRYAQFIRRKFGVVLLTLDHINGIGLITEKEKITTIVPLIRKEGKELRRETLSIKPKAAPQPQEPVDYDEQQPAFIEPPRVILTSHDPAFKDAFKDLNKRNQ